MPVPDLTHLQYLILATLLTGEKTGRDLRRALTKHGAKKSGPAFYQLMARMEDAKLVEGRYETETIEGQVYRERWYKALGAGARAFNRARDFYLSADIAPRGGGLASA